jgi:hypothetical protein
MRGFASSRRLSAFSSNLRHMLAVFRHSLTALATNLCHVLLVLRDGEPAFSSYFMPRLRIHGSRATGTRTLLLLAALGVFVTFVFLFVWMLF